MFSLDSFPCGPLATNALLLGSIQKGKGVIIDPAEGSASLLLHAAKERKLTIESILLTHSHWDHLIDLAPLVDQLKVPVFVHQADSENVRRPGSDGLPLLSPCQGVEKLLFLEEGQRLTVGTLILEVLHTPGHSPGGVSFYLAKQKVLISGDTLFKGSIGNLNLPGTNRALMWSSLKRLAKLPSDVAVYPGHGETTTIGAEKNLMEHAQEIFG